MQGGPKLDDPAVGQAFGSEVAILDERVANDRVTLAAIRADPRITFVDLRPTQSAELRRLLPPPTEDILNEPHRWIHFPWRSTVVGVVGPKAFRTLRLDRNRNKITTTEQNRFNNLVIGVVGLSVGHAVAHTLALEGLCGELRLADFEELETTDLNRIPGTTLDIGRNKGVAAARRIAEIDPYLPVRVYPVEFTPQVCEVFMAGLDLVVEESFSLRTKVLTRVAARKLRIPVVMATSNRGFLDVERFDLEPDRPLFHGLLSEDDIKNILDGTSRDEIQYIVRLLESEKMSPRLVASRAELGRTLSHWPQLGSELQLSGATAATAIRRIGLRESLRSGRLRVDLEQIVDSIRDPADLSELTVVQDAPARRNFDSLVTDVAAKLMGVDTVTMRPATHVVLAELHRFLGTDHIALHFHDRTERTAVLVAEWPVRDVIPDPDPMAVIHFATADDWEARQENALRPQIRQHSDVSVLTVPLVDFGESLGYLTLTASPKHEWTKDAVSSVSAIAALFATLQKRLLADERLRYIATHDDLTNLSNRRSLIEYMERRFEAGMPGPVTTMFIDVDRLKALNDFLGHSAGDEFIRAIAQRLHEQAEPGDMIARLGGDEFVVIPAVPMNADDAEWAAKRIQALIGENVDIGGELISRSASVGVAVGIPGETAVADVLRQADQAMLAAKAAHGNGIAFFTDEMRSESDLRDDIELHLRRAVESDALVLHYQPEVDLQTGEILGVEALVRWNHPTRGLLYPSTFIEIAEATNLAGELGRWVIRRACEQLARWLDVGVSKKIIMRVNVSPVQLVSQDLVSYVERILDETGLDGSSLCFEITEHVVVRDLQRTTVALTGLKGIGASIAIDDFGTGYSSLEHLKNLEVDALKIDKGFVMRLGRNSDDLAIVKSVIGLGRSFGLDLIAEGVETTLASRVLIALGCQRGQGHLISQPKPAAELLSVLKAGYIDYGYDELN